MPEVDLIKRRRVMQRSQTLGHCICDPSKPCPCDVFRRQGICPCAGERPEPIDLAQVKLTQMVHNAGCASKIAPGDLEAVLSRLPKATDPAVLSGVAAGDDAAIYRISDDLCLVQTVDVMTPCCDDPYAFGRVCAANCLSDIYAMGGQPRTALSVLAFPSERLDGRIMYEMLRGAVEVLAEAGVALIGGHSIKDEEIKLGFAITGTVDAAKTTANDRAAVGDVLVLTKPLGTGVINFAHQIGREVNLAAVIESMATVNRAAAEAAAEAGVVACTDVTGFGLYGHLANIVRHSGVTAEVWAGALPAFDGAVELLAAGVVPGAVERNTEFLGDDIEIQTPPDGTLGGRATLGFDAQTSGGLLLCVKESRLEALRASLRRRQCGDFVIGRITGQSSGRIIVTENGMSKKENSPAGGCCDAAPKAGTKGCCEPAAHAADCCGAVANAEAAFGAFIDSATAGGKVDQRAKELVTFALVIMARCEPCIAYHYDKAIGMGITRQELDEVSWLAVLIGGAPVRMFYGEVMAKIGRKS